MKSLSLALLALLPLRIFAEVERAQIDFEFVRRLALERAAAPYAAPAEPPW